MPVRHELVLEMLVIGPSSRARMLTERAAGPKYVTVTSPALLQPLQLILLKHFGAWRVSEIAPQVWDGEARDIVRAQLDRVLNSGAFQQSKRRQRFLKFIVTEALEGRGERLKGYTIAVEVFERPTTFDAAVDPVVRIEAGRLRDKLREYYEGEGQDDPVRIELPKGSYNPDIRFVRSAVPERPSENVKGAVASEPSSGVHSPFHLDRRHLQQGLAAAIIAAALVLIAAFGGWHWQNPVTSGTGKASIAVLPFANIGDDLQWTRFADGVTEDIITDLSHSKDLFVVARNSTEFYRGKKADIREIGRELGVRYVLEGSIQPSNGQIRVTAQLIDAKTGGHAWASRYDRPATDLFAVQRDVTEKIAATLLGYEGAVAQAERSFIKRKAPSNLTAYEYYLLGLEAKHTGAVGAVTKEGLEEAEQLFYKALSVDPNLARAYVGLCFVYEYRLDFGFGTAEDNLAKQMEAAQNAVRLDPNDGEAQLVLGHAFAYQGRAEQALEQFARAEALAPNNADVLILIAWYLPQLNQTARAVELVERALALNPNYASWYNQGIRLVYFFDGKFNRSIKYTKLVTQPQALDYAYLAASQAMIGNMGEARSSAAELARLDPEWTVEKYISDNGGFPDPLANLFVEAAAKAGLATCVPASKLASMPSLLQLKTCEMARSQKSLSQR